MKALRLTQSHSDILRQRLLKALLSVVIGASIDTLHLRAHCTQASVLAKSSYIHTHVHNSLPSFVKVYN